MRQKLKWDLLKRPYVLLSAVITAITFGSYMYYDGIGGWYGVVPTLLIGMVGFIVGVLGARDLSDPRTRRIMVTGIAIFALQGLILAGGRWGQPNDAGLFPVLWSSLIGVFAANIYLREPKFARNGVLIGAGVGVLLSLCLIVGTRDSGMDMGGWSWLPLPLGVLLAVIAISYRTATIGLFIASSLIRQQQHETEAPSALMPPDEDLNLEFDITTGILAYKDNDAFGPCIKLNGTLFRCSDAQYDAFRVGVRYTLYFDKDKHIVGARELVPVPTSRTK